MFWGIEVTIKTNKVKCFQEGHYYNATSPPTQIFVGVLEYVQLLVSSRSPISCTLSCLERDPRNNV